MSHLKLQIWLKTWTLSVTKNKREFGNTLRAMCTMRARVVYVPGCPRVNVRKACQRANVLINVPTYQRLAKSVLKACQLFNMACQRAKRGANLQLRLPKGVPLFQLVFKSIFHFFNCSIMLNIFTFQEYLGNFRKFILQNKKTKFWHLENLIKEKPYQPKSFEVVFSGACGINRVIRLITE